MNKTLQLVKTATKDMVCARHKEKPEIKISKDEVNISTCCETFKKKVLKVAEKTYNEAVEMQVLEMLFSGKKKK